MGSRIIDLFNWFNWAGVIMLVGGSLWLVTLADLRALGGNSWVCHMTFCQWARRILVVVFFILASVQGIVAADCKAPIDARNHFIAALFFTLLALGTMGFDAWMETRPHSGCGG